MSAAVSRMTTTGETPDIVLSYAREYAEDGRASHVAWVKHLEAGPCDGCTPESLRNVGTIEDQREWVRRYDIILLALSLVDETLTTRLVDAIARIGDEEQRKQSVRLARHALRYRAALPAVPEERG